jgi:peptidoglycan/xylan/chitin deacetylase (PgdA/CDA1 family)
MKILLDSPNWRAGGMEFMTIMGRLKNRYRTTLAQSFFKRTLRIKSSVPIVSFTFDDFPRSALQVGGAILESYGFHGTFYASMGRMGNDTAVGELFRPDDLAGLISKGHELGCHTFGHVDSWKTPPDIYERSILRNASVAREWLPGFVFRTFSYPFCQPHPRVKMRAARHFSCCRGGGQGANTASVDLNLLNAFFMEKSRDRPACLKRLIDENWEARGWLIFATHDISSDPSPFGCDPAFFEDIVKYSARSGSAVLPVIRAYEALSAAPSSHF